MKLFVKLSFITFSIFVFSLFSASFVHAQANALQINVIPQNPNPYETVNISIEDFSRDLNKLEILWSVNGTVIDSGTGLKKFQVKTGAIGTVTRVDVNIGGDVEAITLRPSVTDLMWQADTYTPPFYEGKALHSSQDPVIVVAEPFIVTSDGTRLDPNDLVYKWKLGNTVDANASGRGKKSFKIVPSILGKLMNVSVEVTSANGTYKSDAAISIPTSNPEVVFYENHPLYGIGFSNALNNKDFSMTKTESNIVAEPYFFSNAQKTFELLTYGWTLNNSSVNQDGNEITMRRPAEGSGKSLISVDVKNLDRYLQAGKASMYASFGGAVTDNQNSVF